MGEIAFVFAVVIVGTLGWIFGYIQGLRTGKRIIERALSDYPKSKGRF